MTSQTAKLRQKFSLPRRSVTNSHGLTAKQEAFAQLVARGEGLSDAYRATYKAAGKPASINVSASKLAKEAKVKLRIGSLLRETEMAMHRDSVAIRRHVFSGLLKESRNEDAKPSERIAALIALGKIDIVSMFRENATVLHRLERAPELVEEEIRSKLRDLFRPSLGYAPDKSSGTIDGIVDTFNGEQRDTNGIPTNGLDDS